MKGLGWICWILAVCVCASEARYKMRRPLTPPPQPAPQIYKKSWPIAHRMSAGNTIHIGGNYGHKRPVYKPANYRVRRPPVYNVMPTTWKNKIPVLGVMNPHAVLPQRPPVKEFHSMNKVPEYSPEYRPETAVMPPTHRGGMDDDKGAIHTIPAPNLSLADKPYNLVDENPAENNHESQLSRHQYPHDGQYHGNHPGHQSVNSQGSLATNYGFGTLVTSTVPQRTVTSPIPTQNHYEVTESNDLGPRDYHTAQPTFITQDFDVTRLATLPNLDVQTNELYGGNGAGINPLKPGPISGNVQFPQPETPQMQTNLHSSLHVGFPGSAAQAPSSLGQQIPDLHVGHPAPAGPPLSATQLYDLLNSFPQQINEQQYASGQQPHLHQQILQQQLGQLFQPTGESTGFSQPQMHSFNYDEQANKRQQQQQQQLQEQLQREASQQQQQQQQILVDQDYGSGRVTADYNLEPEVVGSSPVANILGNNRNNEEINYRGSEPNEQAENHIEYEESSNPRGPNTYFSKVGNADGVSSQFFTTLPNKEAAEKLAALAAAGNVNSHLIGQIRKQQQQQQQQQERFEDEQEIQHDEPLPPNHKGGDYEVNEPQQDDVAYESQQQRYNDEQERYEEQQRYDEQQQQYEQEQQQFEQQQQRHDEQQKQYEQQQYNRQHFRRQQIRQQQELKDRYEKQRQSHLRQHEDKTQDAKPEDAKKRPMRIMVPDVEEYTEQNSERSSVETSEDTSEDYDYENPETDTRTTLSSSGIRTTYEESPNSEFGTRLTVKKGQ